MNSSRRPLVRGIVPMAVLGLGVLVCATALPARSPSSSSETPDDLESLLRRAEELEGGTRKEKKDRVAVEKRLRAIIESDAEDPATIRAFAESYERQGRHAWALLLQLRAGMCQGADLDSIGRHCSRIFESARGVGETAPGPGTDILDGTFRILLARADSPRSRALSRAEVASAMIGHARQLSPVGSTDNKRDRLVWSTWFASLDLATDDIERILSPPGGSE